VSARSFSGSCACAASAQDAWAAWIDVGAWEGDLITSARLDGPFAPGSTIRVKLKGYPPSTTTITEVDAPARWVSTARAPGLTLTYEHVIEATAGGCTITERALMSGPLSAIAARLIGRRLPATFAATTAVVARNAVR
jgi:hypothetical protein